LNGVFKKEQFGIDRANFVIDLANWLLEFLEESKKCQP